MCVLIEALLTLQPILSFLRNRSISAVCNSEPTAGLHAEDVGVTVKCSLSPTNACMHAWTWLILITPLSSVLSVLEPNHWEKLTALLKMSLCCVFFSSSDLITRMCTHFHPPPLFVQSCVCEHSAYQWSHLTLLSKGVHSPESCDGSLCWIYSARVWQLPGQAETHKPHVFLFSAALQLSAFPPELSINSLLIKNLFRYLRSAFPPPPSFLWRQCVNHYRGVRMKREREQRGKKERLRESERKKKERGWHSVVGEKKLNRRIDGREAGCLR